MTPQIRKALRAKFSMPEWVLMEEVRDCAGFDAKRSADAIAMSLWPSRGLLIHGFEIKASRGDWLRELKDPAKADAIAAYCDHWFIVTAPGVIKDGELPLTWGHMELRGESLRLVKGAPKNFSVKPLNRTFVAAMMRRVGELDESAKRALLEAEIDKAREDAKRTWEANKNAAKKELDRINEAVAKIREKTGVDITSYGFDADQFSAAFKFAIKAQSLAGSTYGGPLDAMRRAALHAIKVIDETIPLIPGHEGGENE